MYGSMGYGDGSGLGYGMEHQPAESGGGEKQLYSLSGTGADARLHDITKVVKGMRTIIITAEIYTPPDRNDPNSHSRFLPCTKSDRRLFKVVATIGKPLDRINQMIAEVKGRK